MDSDELRELMTEEVKWWPGFTVVPDYFDRTGQMDENVIGQACPVGVP